MPAALAAILGIVVVTGLCWALFVPPWQSPDENAQFAYAQSIAERGKLPGGADRPGWSTDQLLADDAVGANEVAFRAKDVKPDWDAADFEAYKRDFARLHWSRSNGGGTNPAGSNPPLYYLYADVAYFATYSGDAFDRLYAMRIWGIPLLAMAALGGWLLAGEVFGRRRLLQLVSAATVGLFPMESFMATSVNVDGMQVALWTFAFWLGARVIVRAGRPRDVLWLAAVTAAAILTKGTSYALVPAVLVAVLIGLLRTPRSERLALGFPYSIAGLVLTVPVFVWIKHATAHGGAAFNSVAAAPAGETALPFKINDFLAYLWQFYLPRLSFMGLDRTTAGLSVYNIWVRTGWGVFGWLEISMPTWLYTVLGAVTGAIGVIGTVIVATLRGAVRWQLMLFFALGFLGLLIGLHLTDYRSIINQQGAILQGRYLLPLLGLFGLAVALIVSRVPARWRAPLCGLVITGLLTVQVIALATIAGAYYT
jgi:4-amino-4-deoxy-L-arabinose transferase-like glycosyltransferase